MNIFIKYIEDYFVLCAVQCQKQLKINERRMQSKTKLWEYIIIWKKNKN